MKVRLERISDSQSPAYHTVRIWPAVPRVGEYIEITLDPMDGTKPILLTGTVRIVMWGDGGTPVVRFR